MAKRLKKKTKIMLLSVPIILIGLLGIREWAIYTLIQEIKKDEFRSPSKYVMWISLIGNRATDPLLAELKQASDHIFSDLTYVLCDIPSAKRDKAFIEILSSDEEREDADLAHWYAVAMIDALAENNCKNAIPVLTEIAYRDSFSEEQIHARVALAAFGQPVEAKPIEDFLIVDDTLSSVMKDNTLKDGTEVMIAVVDQIFCNGSTLTLETASTKRVDPKAWEEMKEYCGKEMWRFVKRINPKGNQHDFSGTFFGGADLEVTVWLLDTESALVYASWAAGNLAISVHLCQLLKRDGRWVVVRWKVLWYS